MTVIRRAKETFSRTDGKGRHKRADICGEDSFRFPCWRQDIHAIFTNLIDNSLYWMRTRKAAGEAD